MAAFLRGLDLDETRALTLPCATRERNFTPAAGQGGVDKHSTGGVGDKTSFLVAPIAAPADCACR